MTRKYRQYTDDDIAKAVSESTTIAQVLDKLNLVKAGGNYGNIQKKIYHLGLDTSHFKGQSWADGTSFKESKDYKSNTHLKRKLIKDRGHKCESCENTHWLGDLIAIELHHVDGVRSNNCDDNLQLLCPNCHAVTDNWRGRNKKI